MSVCEAHTSASVSEAERFIESADADIGINGAR